MLTYSIRWALKFPIRDIDIARRVSFRDTFRMEPKPIICQFIRRLARNEVMSKTKEGRSVDPSTIGLHEGTDMSNSFFWTTSHLVCSSYTRMQRNSNGNMVISFAGREMDLSSFVIQRMKVPSC